MERVITGYGSAETVPRTSPTPVGTTRKWRIAIITVNYFSAHEVVKLVASLTEQTTDCELHMCVVDNSCNDFEWARLEDLLTPYKSSFHSLITHRSDSNSGFSAGNNAGYDRIASFDPDVVIIINPDVILLQAKLDDAVQQIMSDSRVIFGAKTISGGIVISGLASVSVLTGKSRELLPEDRIRKSDIIYPSGHFIAMRNDLWKSVDGLSEDYFLFGEEADLILRLSRLYSDTRVECLNSVLVSHTGGLTSGASKSLVSKSHLTFEHATRSSVILFRKHSPLRRWLPLIVAARTIYALRAAVVAGPTAAKAVFSGLRGGLSWRGNDVG